ncbi:putative alcohol dehydrogenase [Colletotrichum plurivorum]|uniref:Putative alcohol dehydrogenase n=1 Tax=Colletotrichum plurivorum TaxID=2175906 RepID=A0A8H6K380_9PEZI|nr:putative alcohol dehydrogenase [Colletotrichum plurivorum]
MNLAQLVDTIIMHDRFHDIRTNVTNVYFAWVGWWHTGYQYPADSEECWQLREADSCHGIPAMIIAQPRVPAPQPASRVTRVTQWVFRLRGAKGPPSGTSATSSRRACPSQANGQLRRVVVNVMPAVQLRNGLDDLETMVQEKENGKVTKRQGIVFKW